MQFILNDGGRAEAGYKGRTGDCVVRAIAIASGKPYQEVYDAINDHAKDEKPSKRRRGKSSARTGVHKVTYQKYLESLGAVWTPTMFVGQGCKVHLTDGELPMGRLVVSVSRHLVAVIDGVIHDTHDPQREMHCTDRDVGQELKKGEWRTPNGVHSIRRRCVYGFWTFR